MVRAGIREVIYYSIILHIVWNIKYKNVQYVESFVSSSWSVSGTRSCYYGVTSTNGYLLNKDILRVI